jgi:hypothetical protein
MRVLHAICLVAKFLRNLLGRPRDNDTIQMAASQ